MGSCATIDVSSENLRQLSLDEKPVVDLSAITDDPNEILSQLTIEEKASHCCCGNSRLLIANPF